MEMKDMVASESRNGPALDRTAFRTSRLLEFLNTKELTAQIGHGPAAWPLVLVKELLDNALDACEEGGTATEIQVTVDESGVQVADNGPGIPADVVSSALDFSVRVSSREAYVSPTRGAQGNALKTVIAMPFVLNGEEGRVDITAHGVRHEITVRVDRIRQQPAIDHRQHPALVKNGTVVRVYWPDSPCSNLAAAKGRFLQIADDFTFLNPHLTLRVNCWHGEQTWVPASDPTWKKWGPKDPTSPHWYSRENLERLIAAYVSHDADSGKERTVREFVAEFRGLSGTAKTRAILEATGLGRTNLSGLVAGNGLDKAAVSKLLLAMKDHSKPVKSKDLGLIGRNHLEACFRSLQCQMETFAYKKALGVTDGIPWVLESAFAWRGEARWPRRIVTGVNWSPGILNPFRELGPWGQSLDSVLERQRAGKEEPVVLVLHMACPRVQFSDRGKSTVVIDR
jgi:DNA topoisomerase VI subunit B